MKDKFWKVPSLCTTVFTKVMTLCSIRGLSSPPTVPLGIVQLFSISAVTMQKMDLYNSHICMFMNFSSTDSLWKAKLPAVRCYISFCIPLPSWDNEHIEANLFPQLVNKRQPALFCMSVRTHTRQMHVCVCVTDTEQMCLCMGAHILVYPCANVCKMLASCVRHVSHLLLCRVFSSE